MPEQGITERSDLRRAVLPVLDLMGGHIVRGVGGRRNEYRPITSRLTESSEPLAVARALRDHFGFSRLYVADLDGITTGQVQHETIQQLVSDGFELLLDCGAANPTDVRQLLDVGVHRAVLGLESFHSPAQLAEVLQASPRESVVFSLDLKNGRPIADPSRWPSDPIQVANFACERGVDQLIILDLAAVGMRNGIVTAELCRAVRKQHPRVTLITGGGIRSVDEIEAAVACGANQVLVATALHDGSLLLSSSMLRDRHMR